MNKRDRVLATIRAEPTDRTPVGFWLHFPKQLQHGIESANAHVDFFRKTKTDIVKIMNENLIPCTQQITKAEDWKHIRPISMKDAFVIDQLDIIKRITDTLGDETVVLTTIHGTVASAFHARKDGNDYDTLRFILSEHLREQPQIVANAFRIISEGLTELTQACLEAGAHGIYYAALGGETNLFTDEEFERYIKPNDLMILRAAENTNSFNVLHICKEQVNFQRYMDYKIGAVNWNVHHNDLSLDEGRKLFSSSAVMGGLDHSGVLVTGTDQEIEKAVFSILDQMGAQRFILGADCTLPTDISYDRVRVAVEAVEKHARVTQTGI